MFLGKTKNAFSNNNLVNIKYNIDGLYNINNGNSIG